MATIADRIKAGVEVNEAGCWIWQKQIVRGGYGRFTIGSYKDGTRRSATVHRESYIAFKGAIPDGLVIDHLCRVRACCNPNHLEAVTQTENYRRGLKGILFVQPTHCKKGHLLAGENSRQRSKRTVECRTCARLDHRTWYRENINPDAGKVQTHCKNGHEFTPENTYLRKNNIRNCRTCVTAYNRANWRKYHNFKKVVA
jgi:hypothetical protein